MWNETKVELLLNGNLREMDCGHLKGVGCLIEVETIEKPSLGLWLLAAW